MKYIKAAWIGTDEDGWDVIYIRFKYAQKDIVIDFNDAKYWLKELLE